MCHGGTVLTATLCSFDSIPTAFKAAECRVHDVLPIRAFLACEQHFADTPWDCFEVGHSALFKDL